MCETPITLDTGQQVACRNCKQCIDNRINDIVGRCIAESRTAIASHAFTLTYGRDLDERSITYGEAEHPRAAILTYSDFQKFIKLLKWHGFPCRYLIAGEYGGEKGRAHWHGIIFWKTKVPPLPEFGKRKLFVRYDPKTGEDVGFFWPHGWTWWTETTYKTIRYACKYAVKDTADTHAQSMVHYSKKPPLGAAYFVELAEEMAKFSIAPQTREYSFPDVLKRNGERRKFYMPDGTAYRFLAAWDRAWHRLHGSKHPPTSELMDKWEDKLPHNQSFKNELVVKPYNRASSPHDSMPGEINYRLPKNSFGVHQSLLLGVHILETKFGILDADPKDFIADKFGTYHYQTPSGDLLTWTTSEGGVTWRNLKIEIETKAYKLMYARAAKRARQEGRPWLIIPGQNPLYNAREHSPFLNHRAKPRMDTNPSSAMTPRKRQP